MVQQKAVPLPASDMDPYLLDFLENKVNTFVKWDLIRFFHDNPHTEDTAANIARYTGRDTVEVESELRGMVETGVLRSRVSTVEVYSLAADPATRELVNRFVLACDDRQFRVKAINHVIMTMR